MIILMNELCTLLKLSFGIVSKFQASLFCVVERELVAGKRMNLLHFVR